jgi:hypothetical protein
VVRGRAFVLHSSCLVDRRGGVRFGLPRSLSGATPRASRCRYRGNFRRACVLLPVLPAVLGGDCWPAETSSPLDPAGYRARGRDCYGRHVPLTSVRPDRCGNRAGRAASDPDDQAR